MDAIFLVVCPDEIPADGFELVPPKKQALVKDQRLSQQ
jgi:hypothetical protein